MVYQGFVKDHMLANNIKLSTIKVKKKMLVAVKGARRKYDEERKEAKKNEEVTAKEKNLKIIVNDISQIRSLKETLEKTCNMLGVEFESSVFGAEKIQEEAVILISKSTVLKRKLNEKKAEIKKLEEYLKVIEEKRKCLKVNI